MGKQKFKVANARQMADKVLARLKPACERIEIAGSIRRGVECVGDIELVAIAKYTSTGLFPGQQHSQLEALLDELLTLQRLKAIKSGPKYKQYEIIAMRPPMQLDLFIANHDNWGLIHAIRTGPASLSKKMVTPRRRGGLLNDNCVVHGGFVWGLIESPEAPLQGDSDGYDRVMELDGSTYAKLICGEEADFFSLLSIDYIPPTERGAF